MATIDPALIERLHALKRPYVVLHPNYLDKYERGSFVRIDNFAASKQATDYLTGLGHRAIGFVLPDNTPGNERTMAFKRHSSGRESTFAPTTSTRRSTGLCRSATKGRCNCSPSSGDHRPVRRHRRDSRRHAHRHLATGHESDRGHLGGRLRRHLAGVGHYTAAHHHPSADGGDFEERARVGHRHRREPARREGRPGAADELVVRDSFLGPRR